MKNSTAATRTGLLSWKHWFDWQPPKRRWGTRVTDNRCSALSSRLERSDMLLPFEGVICRIAMPIFFFQSEYSHLTESLLLITFGHNSRVIMIQHPFLVTFFLPRSVEIRWLLIFYNDNFSSLLRIARQFIFHTLSSFYYYFSILQLKKALSFCFILLLKTGKSFPELVDSVT